MNTSWPTGKNTLTFFKSAQPFVQLLEYSMLLDLWVQYINIEIPNTLQYFWNDLHRPICCKSDSFQACMTMDTQDIFIFE